MRIPLGSISLLAVALVASCGVEPLGSGSIVLQWQVSPTGCVDAGVDVVEVRTAGPDTVVERFPCTSGGAEFVDMKPGSYRVELHGYDANGDRIFASEPLQTDVSPDAVTQTPTVRLLAAPAAVDVRWTFDNGRVCGANGVRWITIGAFDEYDYEVATARVACDSGEGRLPSIRAGAYLLEVNALDNDAVLRWRGTAPVKVSRGEEIVVDVALLPAL